MGQLAICTQLLHDLSNNVAILKVVQPSKADLIARKAFYDKMPYSRRALPPVEDWRFIPSAGCSLSESNQVVRSNHFLLNTHNVPPSFFHYHVHLFSFDNQSGQMRSEDVASKADYRVTTALMAQFLEKHPEFTRVDGQDVGFVYDSRSNVITTHELPLPRNDKKGNIPSVSEDLCVLNNDGSTSRKRFLLILSFAMTVLSPPDTRHNWSSNVDAAVLRSLDLALLNFARSQRKEDAPSWYLVGNKCFSEHAASVSVAQGYVAMRGYTASLKSCLAGLTLVSDMTVCVFLKGGPIINVIAEVCGHSSVESFLKDSQQRGVDNRDYPKINKVFKNCKVRVHHLVHTSLPVVEMELYMLSV